MRESLQQKAIPAKLGGQNIRTYNVPWMEGGVDPDKHPVHQEYLTQFGEDFISRVQYQVEAARMAQKDRIKQVTNVNIGF